MKKLLFFVGGDFRNGLLQSERACRRNLPVGQTVLKEI